jgi:hypothetical protein
MTRDGRLIALRDVDQIRFFARETGTTVAEALTGKTCPYVPRNSKNTLEDEHQFESVSFVPGTSTSTSATTRTVVEVSECYKQRICQVPVHQFDLLFASDFEDKGQDTATDMSMGSGAPSTSMVPSIAPMDWYTITYDNFEFGISDGNSNFQDGGSDAHLHKEGLFTSSGIMALRLRDNEGTQSSYSHEENHDVSMYSELRISFSFYMEGYDPNENFFLEYSHDGGITYSILREYTRQTNNADLPNAFDNDRLYPQVVHIFPDEVPFTTKVRLRFRSNASRDGDKVYIDDVEFTGKTFASPSTSSSPAPTPTYYYATYDPGNLMEAQAGTGVRLSKGLVGRIIASTDHSVVYTDGSGGHSRSELFHQNPDAGATFPLVRPAGGYVYVSNAEVANNAGGVGAIYFNADGTIFHYERLLTNTSMNCGGGKSPWGTWISVS